MVIKGSIPPGMGLLAAMNSKDATNPNPTQPNQVDNREENKAAALEAMKELFEAKEPARSFDLTTRAFEKLEKTEEQNKTPTGWRRIASTIHGLITALLSLIARILSGVATLFSGEDSTAKYIRQGKQSLQTEIEEHAKMTQSTFQDSPNRDIAAADKPMDISLENPYEDILEELASRNIDPDNLGDKDLETLEELEIDLPSLFDYLDQVRAADDEI